MGSSLGEGGGSNFGEYESGYRIWGFCNFMFNSGMGLLDFPGLGVAGRCDRTDLLLMAVKPK